jgi:hypothetical protein
VWLDADEVQWFGDLSRTVRAAVTAQPLLTASGGAAALRVPASSPPARIGARRDPTFSRRRRLATRLAPTAVSVIAVGAFVPTYLSMQSGAALPATPAGPDTPSPRAAAAGERAAAPTPVRPTPSTEAPARVQPAGGAGAEVASPEVTPAVGVAAPERDPFPAIRWRDSQAVGVPHAGRLVDGVRLPVEGPGWVTWDPVRDRTPNRANRLYGTEVLVRMVVDVIAQYRAAHPEASPVVVGDLSYRGGGEIDEHASHENGLDVDVYYPRRDGQPRPPVTVGQVDHRLAQDLLDRFVAAGAYIVFVGQSTPLRGDAGIVVPYPAHDNHMHVRIAPTAVGPR